MSPDTFKGMSRAAQDARRELEEEVRFCAHDPAQVEHNIEGIFKMVEGLHVRLSEVENLNATPQPATPLVVTEEDAVHAYNNVWSFVHGSGVNCMRAVLTDFVARKTASGGR